MQKYPQLFALVQEVCALTKSDKMQWQSAGQPFDPFKSDYAGIEFVFHDAWGGGCIVFEAGGTVWNALDEEGDALMKELSAVIWQQVYRLGTFVSDPDAEAGLCAGEMQAAALCAKICSSSSGSGRLP